MKKLLCVLIFLVCYTSFIFPQGENNNWYFGRNAGINFNTSPPTNLTNSEMSAFEGCSSISDADGNLLFYTDGSTVWTKNHTIMPNGTNLFADSSSTQAALIVPLPNSDSLFYIFTTDQLAGSRGLRYSIVDISLNNGLGDILTKNQLILNTVCEKVIAMQKCDGDYWVLTHQFGTNSFYAYPLTQNGIGNPVVSNEGLIVNGSVNNTASEMIFSPDNKKVAIAHGSLGVEILDFNSNTGILSNPVTIVTGTHRYGVCFSPDNTKFYTANSTLGGIRNLYQYDMLSSDIPGSEIIIGTINATGAFRNGPDGKIYIVLGPLNFLSVINNPNERGTACDYVSNGFSIESNARGSWGLPNLVQYHYVQENIYDIETCDKSATLNPTFSSTTANYLWSTNDATENIKVSSSDTYWVNTIIDNCVKYTDTFYVKLEDCPTILEMPNVITPNKDGKNDNFIPVKIENIGETLLTIYNRWGQKVYESINIMEGWDGNCDQAACPDGTYYWEMTYTDINEKESNANGIVTLLK